MVLSAFVLTAERGEQGYIMRYAEDFCRQYERVRLPMECFLESLPQTGLQVRGRLCARQRLQWAMGSRAAGCRALSGAVALPTSLGTAVRGLQVRELLCAALQPL